MTQEQLIKEIANHCECKESILESMTEDQLTVVLQLYNESVQANFYHDKQKRACNKAVGCLKRISMLHPGMGTRIEDYILEVNGIRFKKDNK